MKGSTIDSMSEAVDGAEVVLFGVSLDYKESANCRLEANYCMQQEVDMIPLMMQRGYKPRGWLVRLQAQFYARHLVNDPRANLRSGFDHRDEDVLPLPRQRAG